MADAMRQDPMSANRTPLNPADMAFMKKSGQMGQGMTFGQAMENGFGIKWDDPMEVAVQKLQKNVKNANPETQMQNIAQSGGGAQQTQQRPQQPGGLAGLASQMGR